jgi:hypothetical protein
MSNRVSLQKGKVGVNSLGGYEKISALVGYLGIAQGAAGSLAVDKPVEFSNINEFEIYGITPESKPLLYHHASEYFRIAGAGARLHVLSVKKPEEATFAALVSADAVKTLIAAIDGNIFNIGYSYIPESNAASVDGLHPEMSAAIKSAQLFADWCRETNRPVHVVLECAKYTGVAAAALNLRNITEQGAKVMCPQVSVVIGQDFDFAATLTGRVCKREKKFLLKKLPLYH